MGIASIATEQFNIRHSLFIDTGFCNCVMPARHWDHRSVIVAHCACDEIIIPEDLAGSNLKVTGSVAAYKALHRTDMCLVNEKHTTDTACEGLRK